MLGSTPFLGMHADVLLSALVGIVGTVVTLRHYRQVLEYTRRTGRTTENATELQEAGRHLRTVGTRIREHAQRPCGEAEFAPMRRLRHRIETLAAENGLVAAELRDVVECMDRWLATALPPVDAATANGPEEYRTLLGAAMTQEHLRDEVARAVTTALNRIRVLGRSN